METNRKPLESFRQASDSSMRYHANPAWSPAQRETYEPKPARHTVFRGGKLSYLLSDDEQRRQARFIKHSFVNEAGRRDYMLFVPSVYAGQALPLIIMLHGCKQDAEDFAAGTSMNQLAEENGCLVAYPAQAASANAFRCWNWFNSGDQQRGMGEPSIIAGITKQVLEDYGADRSRVYIAGLSAGGSMALVMGHTYPDLYAALAVHSGLPYGGVQDFCSALQAMRHGAPPTPRFMDDAPAISTIVFHGDMDKIVHPENGKQIIAHSMSRAISGVPLAGIKISIRHAEVRGGHAYTRAIHFDTAGNTVAEQWIIHGAGHSWSGGDPKGSFTDPGGPNASNEIMRFFLSRTHPSMQVP